MGALATTLMLTMAVATAQAAPLVNRPAAELFGTHPLYGIAGNGVNSATGNYSRTGADLAFPVGLLGWGRTYNSLDSSTGPFGRGWTPALSAHLVVGGDGSVSFHDDDGRVLTFAPASGGGYTRPQDLDADLTRNADSTFALRYLSGEVWTFDSSGRGLARSVQGTQITFQYDDHGRLATVSHSAGQSLALSYDADGRITSVAANDGRTDSYRYDDTGFLVSVTGPNGLMEKYASNAGLVGKVLDAEDRTIVVNGYDANGRVKHQDYASGGSADFVYDTDAGTATVTGTGGSQAVYRHDAGGRLTTVTDPAGGTFTQTFDGSGHVTGAHSAGGLAIDLAYDGRGNMVSRTIAGATTRYAYDAQDRVTSVTDASGAVTKYGYTGDDRIPSQVTNPSGAVSSNTVVAGLVTEAVDATGAKTSYAYDAGRRLASVTDPVGGTTKFGYDAVGHNTTVTSPLGRVTKYDYDPAGRLVACTDPGGAVTRYHYSSAGLLLDVTDPTGATTKNTYDANGRLAGRTDGLGRTTTYEYGLTGNVETATNPNGGTEKFSYDPFGRVSSVSDAAGAVISYGYDADGRQTQRTAPAGTKVTRYDSRGLVVASTDAAGRTTTYEYDGNGRLISVNDPVGNVSRTAYDANGRVVSRTDPTGAVTRYTYDAAGHLLTTTDPLGHVTTNTWDAAGHLVSVTDAMGGVTRYTYDADGRRTSETSAAGLVVRFEYDATGRLAKTTDPRGGVTAYGYNPRGDQTSVASPTGSTKHLEYDAAGQLTRSVNGNGAATAYTYDGAGNLTSITEPSGSVTRYTYDSAGRQTSSTDPLGRVTKQMYDESGNLTSVTDPAGKTLRMAYDAVGELLKRTGSDGTTESYTYDAGGRRASMTDATGTTAYTYDAANRIASYTEPDGASYALGYDAAGRRIRLTYPDKLTVQYSYDNDGRLTGISDPRAGTTTYTLNPDGLVLAEQLPDGISRGYGYDGGLLVKYQEAGANGPRQDTTLVRDADGRVIKQSDQGRTYQFGYDRAGQLVSVDTPGHDAMAITYDADGNRTGVTGPGTRKTLRYDAADQLVSSDDGPQHVDYGYDPSGRLISQTGHVDSLNIDYNSFGQAATRTVTHGGETTVQRLTYNGDGLLVGFVTGHDPGDVAHFQWSVGDQVPQILQADGVTDFVYGYGRVSADTAHGSDVFSRDVYGSAVRTPQTADWAQGLRYDVFGSPDNAGQPSLTGPRFGYRGELSIGDDAVYLRARWYEPDTGLFTSRDPLSTLVGQTRPASPYPYADSDPLDKVDPAGKFALFDFIGQLLSFLQEPPAWLHCWEHPDPGNDLGRHEKCFQGRGPLWTRGWNMSEDCLNGDEGCLGDLWNSGAEEKAAHALAINELARQEESWWSRFKDDQLGLGTYISQDIDWEVGDNPGVPGVAPDIGYAGFRIDIVTKETNIYEVKRYEGESTTADVDAQLQRYQDTALYWYDITFQRGTELQHWATTFPVYPHWYTIFPTEVYVWGLGNKPGHVYFADDGDRVPSGARAKADENEDNGNSEAEQGAPPCVWCIPIPIIPEVPVVPV